MTFYRFSKIAIKALSVVVPSDEISIYDEAKYYGNNLKKVERLHKIIGCYKRRIAADDVTAADLGEQAAANLISETKLDKNTLDALLFVVQKPDYTAPSTAYALHHNLGLPKTCTATDINQGCVGWCYGLWMACQMIQSGAHSKVLLINADTPQKGMDPADRNNAPLFGDAGCATLLEKDENAQDITFNMDTLSEGFDALIIPAGGSRLRFDSMKTETSEYNAPLFASIEMPSGYKTNLMQPFMDGGAVFEFTMTTVPANLKALMEYTQSGPEDYQYLCLHQANKQIVQSVGEAAGFPLEKVPYDAFENFGNNTMCSIPTTLASVALDDITSSGKKILCCGFGNGLVCLSMSFSPEYIICSGIKEYRKAKEHQSREQVIEYWVNKIKNKY